MASRLGSLPPQLASSSLRQHRHHLLHPQCSGQASLSWRRAVAPAQLELISVSASTGKIPKPLSSLTYLSLLGLLNTPRERGEFPAIDGTYSACQYVKFMV
ncbi:hypothetical protein GW17_00046080 [Ensete ventricosum]|nr:hypothetical protein GW17_00046080 [Ensete ventricosum]